jgi:plasmid stabilization system protein ParE
MTYRVVLTPNAEQSLRHAYRYIRKHALEVASRWIKGARKSIKTLSRHPERCTMVPESISFQEPFRELLYGHNRGVYRILFVVLSKIVHVLDVRHGSRDELQPED